MASQDLLKQFEEMVSALTYFDLDKLRDAIREELMVEVRDEVRQELIDEIRGELEDAANAANESDAPEIGTEKAWGKDEAAGLNRFLELFDLNW